MYGNKFSKAENTEPYFLDHSVVKLEISDKIKAISNPNCSWDEEENEKKY